MSHLLSLTYRKCDTWLSFFVILFQSSRMTLYDFVIDIWDCSNIVRLRWNSFRFFHRTSHKQWRLFRLKIVIRYWFKFENSIWSFFSYWRQRLSYYETFWYFLSFLLLHQLINTFRICVQYRKSMRYSFESYALHWSWETRDNSNTY